MWKPQIESLANFHVNVPDLPGHGQSTDIQPFTINNSAERVAELIRTCAHKGKAHVVRLSKGAQIALALLAREPQIFRSAILSSALVHPLPGANLMNADLISYSVKWFTEPFKKVDWWIRLNMKYSAGVPGKYFSQFKQDFQNLKGVPDCSQPQIITGRRTQLEYDRFCPVQPNDQGMDHRPSSAN